MCEENKNESLSVLSVHRGPLKMCEENKNETVSVST
jgi:hypothetical protein